MLRGRRAARVPEDVGSKGLQVYVPLNRPDVTFDATKAFAKAVAEVLAEGRPDLVVARQAKTLRAGKVLVDWYQNDSAKTTIGVYSLRAREQPTVSAPVSWDEVEAAADSGDGGPLVITIAEILARVTDVGDLFAEVLSTSQRLPALAEGRFSTDVRPAAGPETRSSSGPDPIKSWRERPISRV